MSSAWSLSLEELDLVVAKPAVQRLGFAIQLKMYHQHGRFFETVREVPVETIETLAVALGRPITDVLGYDWEGRSGRRHRDEILKLVNAPRLSAESREAYRMTQKSLSTVCRGRRRNRPFAPAGRRAAIKTSNISYGKYAEQYQYLKPFSAKCHAEAIAYAVTRETLLRNQQVMQQGCAC